MGGRKAPYKESLHIRRTTWIFYNRVYLVLSLEAESYLIRGSNLILLLSNYFTSKVFMTHLCMTSQKIFLGCSSREELASFDKA